MEKRIILMLVLVMNVLWLSGQSYDCTRNLMHGTVIDAHGAVLLEDANESSRVIEIIQPGEEVTVCGKGGRKLLSGTVLAEAFYKGHFGYIDRSALSFQEDRYVNVSNSQIDGSMFVVSNTYIGIFERKTYSGESYSHLEYCNIITDAAVKINGEYQPTAIFSGRDRPRIMITGYDFRPSSKSKGRFFDDFMMLPGAVVRWDHEGGSYCLFARGVVEGPLESERGYGFEFNMNPILEIKNYEFCVRRVGSYHEEGEEQCLQVNIEGGSRRETYAGPVMLHWIGDMDNDHKLDLVLSYNENYGGRTMSVFLSTQAEEGFLLKEVIKNHIGY